jgi:predicted N-formylglutamate amidohydrolase
MFDLVIISCEHGGNRVPARYRSLFSPRLLESHRGYDPGALPIARRLSSGIDAELHVALTTRLLVDLNRSLHHQELFSPPVKALDAAERQRIIDRYYLSHRNGIEQSVRREITDHRSVLHLGVHTFTPVRHGERRRADVGLLYDTARPKEYHVARQWQDLLRKGHPRLIVRRNYPYRGAADGLTTHLRALFPPRAYLGLELEVNQRHARKPHSAAVAGVLETFEDLVTRAADRGQ